MSLEQQNPRKTHPFFSDFEERPKLKASNRGVNARTSITPEQIKAIKQSYYAFDVSQKQLAIAFGLSVKQIQRALSGWADTESR